MKKISRTFFAGLLAVLPVFATFYVLFWLVATVEGALANAIRFFVPAHYYRPGMGVIASLVLVFAAGVLLRAWIVRKLFDWAMGIMNRIPVVKSVYGAFRDVMQFVSKSGKESIENRQVVMVRLGDTNMELMGFVTKRDFEGLPDGIGKKGHVAVYIPMSYQIGGHTVILPETAVRPVEASMEQAMRFVLSAGMMTMDSKEISSGSACDA